MSEKNPGSRKVCRAILDRHSVMSNQVVNLILEVTQGEIEKDKMAETKRKVESIFQQHTNGLVDQVLEMFSNKK